jgi:hypothetical protein
MLAQISAHQYDRSSAIRRFGPGTRSHHGVADRIVELAGRLANCPIAFVPIIHPRDQRFGAAAGSMPGRPAFSPRSTPMRSFKTPCRTSPIAGAIRGRRRIRW